MINGQKIVVVMPAYNASRTLSRTINEIDRNIIDAIILVDDCSVDNTLSLAEKHDVIVHRHDTNQGYGGNQKTCYRLALEVDADIVVMVHPDYQYDPHLVPALAWMIAGGVYDAALGSRILGGGALRGGMPVYKYLANRGLTAIQNVFTGAKLSEYHTGYRAFSRQVLETLPFACNSDDFVFDNEVLCQLIAMRYRIGEISCPTRYFSEASSITLRRSIKYGLGVLSTTLRLVLHRTSIRTDPIFIPRERRTKPA